MFNFEEASDNNRVHWRDRSFWLVNLY